MIETGLTPNRKQMEWAYANFDNIIQTLGPTGCGGLIIPRYIAEDQCDRVARELRDPYINYDRVEDIDRSQIGKSRVHQRFAGLTCEPSAITDRVGTETRALFDDATTFVRAIGRMLPEEATPLTRQGLVNWMPDIVFVNAYHLYEGHNAPGLTSHKDPAHYQYIIVTDDISGGAISRIVDAEGEVIDEHTTSKGDRILYRAPGLYSADYHIGPEHSVVLMPLDDGSYPERFAITYRQASGDLSSDANPILLDRERNRTPQPSRS